MLELLIAKQQLPPAILPIARAWMQRKEPEAAAPALETAVSCHGFRVDPNTGSAIQFNASRW